MQGLAGAEHGERRKTLHVDVAHELGVIFDIGPGEHDLRSRLGEAIQHLLEVAAGAAPVGAQRHDDKGRGRQARVAGEGGDWGQQGKGFVH